MAGGQGQVPRVVISCCSLRRFLPLALLGVTALGACEAGDRGDAGSAGAAPLSVWAHAGQQDERAVVQAQAERFNAAHPNAGVELTLIPEGSYHAQVQAAALAGDLPDVLELDGPFVAAYAWQGHLRPLDALVPDSLLEALLPSIVAQGRYRGRLWSLGTFDSGLGLLARRSALEAVGARIPIHPEDAWSVEELERILAALAERDEDGAPLDLHLDYRGEWYTYAFQPALRSAGGGLLRTDGPSDTAVLTSAPTVRTLERMQRWIERGWVEPNMDDAALVEGRVAISWSGHWSFGPARDRWGDDVVALPLPDFGHGSRTGQGSWVWSVTSAATEPERAAAWIRFVLSPEEIRATTQANGAVPARSSVAQASSLYGPGRPLGVWLEALRSGWSVPRPPTPAYPFATSAFQEVMEAVRNGEDVTEATRTAARLIAREIADNRGYPTVGGSP
jgi:multiple sugar transport system substrate-binding protein